MSNAYDKITNKKIVLGTLLVIILSVSLLISLEIQFPLKRVKALDETIDERFFLQDFSKTENIVLIGTSHVGDANTTAINQQVNILLAKNYTVYNLGEGADNPSKRVNQIDKIISMKPKVVFYGVSYYDFPAVTEKDRLLIKTTEILSQLLHNGTSFDNPQLFTRYYLLSSKTLSPKNNSQIMNDHCFIVPNTPFDEYCGRNRTPDSIEMLKKMPAPVWINNLANEHMDALSKIIEKFQKNGIKIVLFVTPTHKTYYIDRLSDYQKDSFEDIIKKVSSKYNVDVYDFRYRYDDLPIWSDTSHIIESNGNAYDYDIAKMIVEETQ